MIAYEITEIRAFMAQLLLRDTFDSFLVSDVHIRTFTDFRIGGDLYPEFYGEDHPDSTENSDHPVFSAGTGEKETAPAETYASWSLLRPHCLNLIRGRRTPLMFQIVFRLSAADTRSFVNKSGLSFSPEDVEGLLMTCRFRDGRLIITSGVSLSSFYPDKSLEHAWDEYLTAFLSRSGI